MAVNDSVEMYKNECDVVVHGEEVLWLEVVGDSYRRCLKRTFNYLLFWQEFLFRKYFLGSEQRERLVLDS